MPEAITTGAGGLGVSPIERLDPAGPCQSCGVPYARIWGTSDGPARLCPTCASLHGIGCP